jgi:hypothetical protein
MTKFARYREALAEFWLRPFEADVEMLNKALAKNGETAGIEKCPPSVITGDPFSNDFQNCLIVLGINPKWQKDNDFQKIDVNPAEEAWRAKDFERYTRTRADYFTGAAYYGRYFTRLGNALASGFFGVPVARKDQAKAARSFFSRHVVKLDILPWWSENVNGIDPQKIDPTLEPIRAWRRVIEAAIAEFKPQAIVVNGCGWRPAIKGLLGCELSEFKFRATGEKGGISYFGTVASTPLLAHGQLGAPSGAGHEEYRLMVSKWRAARL